MHKKYMNDAKRWSGVEKLILLLIFKNIFRHFFGTTMGDEALFIHNK
jgi:hypothetical protein